MDSRETFFGAARLALRRSSFVCSAAVLAAFPDEAVDEHQYLLFLHIHCVRAFEIDDIVADEFGLSDSQGAVVITSDRELASYARIYNDPMFSQYASWPEPPIRVFVDRGEEIARGQVVAEVGSPDPLPVMKDYTQGDKRLNTA